MIRNWVPKFTNLNPGDTESSKVIAEYEFDGRKIEGTLAVTLGLNGSVGFNPSFTLPIPAIVPRVSNETIGARGTVKQGSNGLPLFVVANDYSQTSALLWLNAASTSGYQLITASYPATWQPGHQMLANFEYRPLSAEMPCTFGAVGDSITAWDSNQSAYNPATSWTNFVPQPGLDFAGGVARGSASTSYLLTQMRQIHADATVVLAGINDIYFNIPLATTLSNLTKIANIVKTPIVLCALAPYDGNPQQVLLMNAAYASLATSKGWVFIDPWTTQRAPDGKWIAGASADGVHPGLVAQQVAAAVIQTTLQ